MNYAGLKTIVPRNSTDDLARAVLLCRQSSRPAASLWSEAIRSQGRVVVSPIHRGVSPRFGAVHPTISHAGHQVVRGGRRARDSDQPGKRRDRGRGDFGQAFQALPRAIDAPDQRPALGGGVLGSLLSAGVLEPLKIGNRSMTPLPVAVGAPRSNAADGKVLYCRGSNSVAFPPLLSPVRPVDG